MHASQRGLLFLDRHKLLPLQDRELSQRREQNFLPGVPGNFSGPIQVFQFFDFSDLQDLPALLRAEQKKRSGQSGQEFVDLYLIHEVYYTTKTEEKENPPYGVSELFCLCPFPRLATDWSGKS